MLRFITKLSVLLLMTALSNVHTFQQCEIQQAQIICNGYEINDASLIDLNHKLNDKYDGMYFEMLIISDTHITKIPTATFSTVLFENIIIEDNENLETIDELAFTEQNSKTLYIINNKLLKNNSIYKLTHRLHVSEAVDFDFNGLQEVPSYAFNAHFLQEPEPNLMRLSTVDSSDEHRTGKKPATFQKLLLSNNHIEQIRSNAFHHMEKCTQIYLNNNQVQHIAAGAFNIIEQRTLNDANDHLQIFLANNQLNCDSFEQEFIHISRNSEVKVFLDLSNNHIEVLHEDVWRPLLESGQIYIDLNGNSLQTTSPNMTWLIDSPKLLVKIKGLKA